MLDYILEITYASDAEIDEEIQSRLFLTASTGNFSADRDGQTVVTAFFDSRELRDAAMPLFPRMRVCAEDRPRVDWLERYEQSLEPLRIGSSFVVAPDARLIASRETRHRIIVPQ